MSTQHAPDSVVRPILRRISRGAYHALAATGACFLLYFLCFEVSVVTSNSMKPALNGNSSDTGEWVLTERISYRFRDPKRWEIITFRNPQGTQVMKRVVGLPGEAVSVQGGRAHINGENTPRPLPLNYLKYYPYGNLRRGAEFTCDRGYYVLGDDSRDSQDSRYEGTIKPEQIHGRAWAVVWPPNKVRLVNTLNP